VFTGPISAPSRGLALPPVAPVVVLVLSVLVLSVLVLALLALALALLAAPMA